MVVGCYTLDLYCDGDPECRMRKPTHQGSPPAQYSADTEGECKALARKIGWVFRRDGTVLCRRCRKKGEYHAR